MSHLVSSLTANIETKNQEKKFLSESRSNKFENRIHVDLEKIKSLRDSLVPLTFAEWNYQDCIVQLWKYKNNLIASVEDTNGDLHIIPGRNVHNSLQPYESSACLINRLEKIGLKKWSFAYLKETNEIYLWPFLIAAGKDGFTDKTEKLKHMFSDRPKRSDDPGHFTRDTPENRQKMNEARESREPPKIDKYGSECYLKKYPDGTQSWAKVRNGEIVEGGTNKNPSKFLQERIVRWPHRFFPLSGGGWKDTKSKGRVNTNVPYQHIHNLAKNSFRESIQQNHLADSYNSNHHEHPIAEKGASGGSIGGVGNEVGIIEGLFDQFNELEETHHYFYIPSSDGEKPFKDEELQQILRELAVGIFRYDTIPFFSLHFNGKHNMYPVIHPAYQNTLVGRVISLLDYYMKGFLNGAFFDSSFIRKWQKTKTHDKEYLASKCIDLHKYCKEHLGSEHRYFSVREMIDLLENANGASLFVGTQNDEPSIFSDYSGFRSSFRIIAKQNSIKKADNLFLLDGDFDVLYTIEPDPVYEDELRKFRSHFGHDPLGYQRLVLAYEAMCEQIKTTMPHLPIFKKLFEQLKVINFFSYYYKTLKKAQKVPLLDCKQSNKKYYCFPLFPHLPILKIKREEVTIDLGKVFDALSEEDQKTVIDYLKEMTEDQEVPEEILDIIEPSLRAVLQEEVSFPLSEEDSSINAPRKIIRDYLRTMPKIVLEKESELKSNSEKYSNTGTTIKKCTKDSKKWQHEKLKLQKRYQSKEVSEQLQHCKHKIEKYEKKQKKYETIRKLKKGGKYLFEYCFKQNKMPFLESNSVIEFFHEQAEEDLSENKRIVGGCGLDLKNLTVSFDPAGKHILDQALPDLIKVSGENFVPVKIGEKIGHVFKLQFADFSASENKEYGWMSFLLTDETEEEAELKAQVFESIYDDDAEAFEEALKQLKENVQIKDPNGIPLIHYAASVSSDHYLKKLLESEIDLTLQDPNGFTALHYATAQGLTQNVRRILRRCPDLLNVKAKNGATALYTAVQQNRLETVKYLIGKEARLNSTTSHGMTALYCAIHHGFEEIALELLQCEGINVDLGLEDGTTPLYLAVECGMVRVAKRLLEKGANVNARRKDSYTALHICAKKGSEAMCRLLLRQSQIDINVQLKSGRTPIHLAAEWNHPEIVHLFLRKGSDLSYVGWDGETALMTAIRSGNTIAAEYMIALHENRDFDLLNHADNTKENPLGLALRGRYYSVLEALLTNGVSSPEPAEFLTNLCKAKVDPLFIRKFIVSNDFSKKALRKACYEAAACGHNQMVTLFQLFYGVKNFTDDKGWSFLHFAAKFDDIHQIQLFLNGHPEDLLQMSKEGKSLAAIAALNGSHRVLKLLLEAMSKRKIPLDKQFKGKHILVAAIEDGNLKTVDIIIHSILDPNIVLDDKGKTAGHFATSFGDVEMLELLRTRGASFDIPDKDGATAFHYAFKYRWDTIIRYFLDSKYEFVLPKNLLHFSVVKSSVNQTKKLIERGYDVNVTTVATKETSLFKAIREENYEVFVTLCEYGAHLESRSSSGMTPLLLAASLGKIKFLSYLIPRTKKNQTSPEGNNALHLAATFGHEECVEYLLSHGYDSSFSSAQGKTALELAQEQGNTHIVLQLERGNHNLLSLKNQIVKSLKMGEEALFFELINNLPLNKSMVFDIGDKKVTLPLLHLIYTLVPHDRKSDFLSTFLEIEGVDRNVSCPQGKTIFHLMLRHNEKVDFDEIDPLSKDKDDVTLLHLCAAQPSSAHLKEALRKTGRINVNNAEGNTPLHYAITHKRPENVKILLEKGADPNCMTHKRISPLMLAVEMNQPEIARLLLQYGAKIDQQCRDEKDTALLYAISRDCFDMARLLIHEGADVNKANANGITPVHSAALKGNLGLLRLLNASGASLKSRDHQGRTIVHYAVMSNNPDIIDYLVSCGIALEQKTELLVPAIGHTEDSGPSGLVPIHFAAQRGNLEMVKKLLEKGCNPEALSQGNWSALAFAAHSGSKPLMTFFEGYRLFHDADQRTHAIIAAIYNDSVSLLKKLYPSDGEKDICVDKEGRTPFHYAAMEGATRCTSYLMEKGENLQKADEEGYTPFELAVVNNNSALARSLSQHEAEQCDLNGKTASGKPYLHLACEEKNLEMATLLIELGASIDDTDSQGYSALHIAAKKGNYPLIHRLLALGADPEKMTPEKKSVIDLLPRNASNLKSLIQKYCQARKEANVNGDALLHIAVRLNDTEHLPILLRQEDVNQKNLEGYAPIHLAVFQKNLSIMRILVDKGASLEIKDDNERTPLHLAAFVVKDLELVRFLLCADPEPGDCDGIPFLYAVFQYDDKQYAKQLFALWLDFDSKESIDFPKQEMLTAIKENDVENFFRYLTEGHPLKNNSFSLLHLAAASDSAVIVEILLNWCKMDFNAVDHDDISVLNTAIENDSENVVAVLLKHGVNFDDYQPTENLKIKKLLSDVQKIEEKAQLLGISVELVKAFFNDDLDAFNRIYQNGLDIKHKFKGGSTFLHLSAEFSSARLTGFLIKSGLEKEAADEEGNTPLHVAAIYGNSEILCLLLAMGTNPNIHNAQGWTAFSIYLERDKLKKTVIAAFLENKTDPNVKCDGVSQTQLALLKNKTQLFLRLLRYGAETKRFAPGGIHTSELNIIRRKEPEQLEELLRVYCFYASKHQNERMLKDLCQLYFNESELGPLYQKIMKEYSAVWKAILSASPK